MLRILAYIIICLLLWSCVWNGTESNPDFLPLDDSEYPYAELPRIVVETDDFSQIRDRETKIPAKFQIYGKSGPESNVLDLTVKGRGHSSFTMAKYSIKLKFNEAQSLFGMPADKEWDLVSNQRDKSMLRNYITYQLARILQDEYSPQCRFVEFYLNRNYMGVYLLVEHVKVAPHRVNLVKSDSSFLFEKTREADDDDIVFESSLNCVFNIKYPKAPNQETINLLKTHVNKFENKLSNDSITLSDWIDIDDFVRYYWIQEFSKNIDGAFGRSIFITWQFNEPFKMGPVWDFDVTYGIGNTRMMSPNDWYVRYQGWYQYLIKNKIFKERVNQYWKDNKELFVDLADSIASASNLLKRASKNEFKRWPVLENDEIWPFVDSYSSYEATIDSLKFWTTRRIQWIDEHL
jgi:spore coat protein CotH